MAVHTVCKFFYKNSLIHVYLKMFAFCIHEPLILSSSNSDMYLIDSHILLCFI